MKTQIKPGDLIEWRHKIAERIEVEGRYGYEWNYRLGDRVHVEDRIWSSIMRCWTPISGIWLVIAHVDGTLLIIAACAGGARLFSDPLPNDGSRLLKYVSDEDGTSFFNDSAIFPCVCACEP